MEELSFFFWQTLKWNREEEMSGSKRREKHCILEKLQIYIVQSNLFIENGQNIYTDHGY